MSGVTNILLGQGSVPAFTDYNAVNFDGTNDYIQKGANYTGASPSKLISGSVWLDPTNTTGGRLLICRGAGFNVLAITLGGGAFQIQAQPTGGTGNILNVTGSAGTVPNGSWTNVLFCFDMSDTAKRFIVANGVSKTLTVTTYTDAAIAFDEAAQINIGSDQSGTNQYNGCMAEFWVAYGVYIDFSNAANVAKFYSGTGKPVNLGIDGSAPTGTPPIMHNRAALAGTAASFATNLGTGGSGSITGTLDICASAP